MMHLSWPSHCLCLPSTRIRGNSPEAEAGGLGASAGPLTSAQCCAQANKPRAY